MWLDEKMGVAFRYRWVWLGGEMGVADRPWAWLHSPNPVNPEEAEAEPLHGLQNWNTKLGLLTSRPALSCHGKLRVFF